MKARKRDTRKAPLERSTQVSELWLYVIGVVGALFAAFQVYAPALHGPFLFDDIYLPMNVPFWVNRPLSGWLGGVRPVLMLSYWTNYQLAGSDTAPYHQWNVFFHFLNTVLVYFIAGKLLEFVAAPKRLALFAVGLFLLHPLQTESVAYITGRSESLSGVFFLGAYALFLYRRSQAIGWPTALGVLTLFAAAMATKENTVVLPALLLLTDYFWNPGFSLDGIRRNWRLYAPMAAGAIVGAAGVFRILGGADSAGFGMKQLPWSHYLFTQFRVLFVYLRLFLFPAGQTIDYDLPISRSILDQGAIFGLIGIIALTVAAWYFRRRFPLACFGFLAFAIILAPTSSIIPIKDPIAEHRLYLPMIGLALIAVESVRHLRIGSTALAVSLSALLLITAVLTYQRNIAWSGAVAMWEDAARKSPRQARAHFQLGYAYYVENRCQEADQQYGLVAQLEKPDYRLLVDWALVANCLNKNDDAIAKLQQAAAIEKTADVYTNLGMMYHKTGRIDQALEAWSMAQSIDPNFEMTYFYRGQLFASLNNPVGAEQQFRRTLAINPQNQQAINALQQLQQSLRTRP